MKGYQLKITIKGSKPPIWRRVIVPEKITFADMDDIIEAIFGWEHEHLYEFHFKDEDVRFTVAGDFGGYEDEDAEKEFIDSWMWEGRKFQYTYDFGDYWEHDILIEKIVPYENRYAQVTKSKGPYMIEDCGGLWGFYDYIDEAREFDIEEANSWLKKVEFGVTEPNREEPNREVQQYPFPADIKLEQVFLDFSKDNLTTIAKAHGFTRYSGFKKKELAQWLANHLLDTVYMKKTIEEMSEDETGLFEEAAGAKGGIWISEDLLAESLFLCSYGAFSDKGLFVIPADVREKYDKLCTPELRKKRKRGWNIKAYCESAVYLYGVLSLEKMIEIYNRYEEDNLTEEEIRQFAPKMEEEGRMFIEENYLTGAELMGEEGPVYKYLLEQQKDTPYYLPDDKEEFLDYGRLDCQEPDENTEKFITYLQTRYKLDFPSSLIVFYNMQEEIRMDYPIDTLLECLDEALAMFGKKLNSYKQLKEAEDQIKNMRNYTRTVEQRGHTLNETRMLQQQDSKIVRFPSGKKIYPNDLCPCGSGKKYKHCCGKKN